MCNCMGFGNFKYVIFLWITSIAFSQQKIFWEDQIYAVTDALVALPNAKNMEQAEILETQFYQSAQPKSVNSYLALVILYCNKAYYQNQLGRPLDAIATYEKAWRLFASKQLDRYDIVEYCYKPLGNLYLQTGQYSLAENCIKQYYYLSTKNNNTAQKVSAVINLSIVYQNTGQAERAFSMLEEALEKESMTLEQRCKIWNNLATNAMLLKKYAKANYYLDQILNAHRNDDLHWKALRNKMQMYLETNESEQALQTLIKAEQISLKLSNINKRDFARFCYEKAVVWVQLQNTIQAKKALNEVYDLLLPQFSSKNRFPKASDLYLDTLFLDVLDLQKQILYAEHQVEEALQVAQQAFLFEEKLMRSLAFEQNQLILQSQSHKRVAWCLDVYLELYAKTKKNNWLEQAFLMSENHKSAMLLRNQQKYSTPSVKEKKLYQEINTLGLLIEKEQQKYAHANINAINRWIVQQSDCVLALKTMQQKAEVGIQWNLKSISQFLQKNKQTLVSYFMGDEHTFFFKLENGNLSCSKLCTSEMLKSKIRSYLAYYTSPEKITSHVTQFTTESHNLYLALGLRAIQNKKIIIIPDGLLRFLPFESLVVSKSASTNFTKIPFLVFNKEISYNHSINTLKSDFKRYKSPKVLGVFPVFKGSEQELVFSNDEKNDLQDKFEGKYVTGVNANFITFVKDAKHYQLLHLSTHASAGDLETSASIKFIDRDVFYSELYGLNLHPDLVVLSACETGLGKLYSGDSPLNVARGFQVAGASNLVFTLWKVNDFTTSKLMSHFYDQLKKGRHYEQALHLAKLDFLKDAEVSNAKKSPYYWGAFVYYGQVEKSETSPLFFVLGVILLVAILILEIGQLFFKNKE
ncbi:CHAT domain-containing protein [Flavobacterium sp.]|uniref:CHAT domain-containing protein n=1 Tax=Flavobacterium sp. TaxID=239 RepID=UPI003D10E60E